MSNIVLVLCVICAAFGFEGCSKSPTNNSNTEYASATIDGTTTFSIPFADSSWVDGGDGSRQFVDCSIYGGEKILGVSVIGGTTGTFPFYDKTGERFSFVGFRNSTLDTNLSIPG